MTAEQADHDFDFWLGDWELSWAENKHGRNQIRRILDEAIIQENFETEGYRGMSLSALSKEDHRWHQSWVDSSGAYLDFAGEFNHGKMILRRDGIADGKPVRQRMVWYDIAGDNFQWNWERSENHGETWQVVWNIQYKRRVDVKS
jgi:hypothetical protein